MAKKQRDNVFHHSHDKRVGGGGQNAGSAKTMSGGNKRGSMGGGSKSMGIKPRDNYPGGMGNS
jgi:hypothetical protein